MQPSAPAAADRLSHLKRLEAESIHIFRETVAETENPVMLYSIGKDSSVLLHLALKAFAPGRLPFPLLHVDTTWKFREMIAFRDARAKELGLDLLVHTNQDGLARGVGPISHGSEVHTDVMKTQALRQALDKHKFDAAFGGARRDEEASRAKERIISLRTAQHRWDPKRQRAEPWHLYNLQEEARRVPAGLPAVQLDRARYLALHRAGKHPDRAALLRQASGRWWSATASSSWWTTTACRWSPARPRSSASSASARSAATRSPARSRATPTTLPEIIGETLAARTSERQGRVIDKDGAGAMERKKQEGYF